MGKVKLFITATAFAGAIAGAAFTARTEPVAYATISGYTSTDECIRATATVETDCSINNQSTQCTVYITNGWGEKEYAAAYYNTTNTPYCLAPMRRH